MAHGVNSSHSILIVVQVKKLDAAARQEAAEVAEAINCIFSDKEGFWQQARRLVDITKPIISLLRLLDGEKPCLSKIYPRCSLICSTFRMMVRWPYCTQLQAL